MSPRGTPQRQYMPVRRPTGFRLLMAAPRAHLMALLRSEAGPKLARALGAPLRTLESAAMGCPVTRRIAKRIEQRIAEIATGGPS
jgi:hypothetical protein